MNKFQFKSSNNNPLQIPINENYKEKIFSLASSHELSELEDFITTNSISLKLKNDKNETITHVLLKGESTILEDELLRCMKFLVERGAPISSIDSYYLTPLFICIEKKYSKIFKYLLEKGASLDINTYDNLNILHTIAKPEHTIFDTKNGGIQDLIPEKLPKIKIEGYKEVYEKINKVIAIEDAVAVAAAVAGPRPRPRPELSPALIKINEGLEKFKTIANQFYYDNEREDFNNILLIEDFKNTDDIEQKNDLFGKLKDQLKYFYDDTENIDEYELKNELDQQIQNNITNLNNEITQTKMHQLNNNLLSAIKNLARSLELSIHYFFLKDPENTYIATDVVIAIAESARERAGAGAEIAAINNALTNTTVMRAAIQAVKTATIVAKKDRDIGTNIVTIIQRRVVRVAAAANQGAGVGAMINPIQIASNDIDLIISNRLKANNIQNQVQAAIVQPPLVRIFQPVLTNGIVNAYIDNANTYARNVVKEVALVKRDINNAFVIANNALVAVLPQVNQVNQVQVIVILQTVIRAAVYAAVYTQNKTNFQPAGGGPVLPQVANLPAIYTAVIASVLAGVQQTVNINQEEIQRGSRSRNT